MKTKELPFNTILRIITSFYDKATADMMIGFHFRHIEDFSTHLPRISSFWQLQLFGHTENTSSIPFDLIKVHLPLKVLPGQVDRWVVLFNDNLELYSQEVSEDLKIKWSEKVHHFAEKIKQFSL
jgi:truncated hemoglobin YjbI